jgi:hypothetical protein
MKTLHSSLSTLNLPTNAVEFLSGDADQATIIAKINEMLTGQRR